MVKLEGMKPRLYQETILNTCVTHNCLTILPTGMGKTAVALMLTIQRLSSYPTSKVIMLAPTKPLAEQHYATFTKHITGIPKDNIVLFTGSVTPKKRQELFKKASVILSTPQGLENDLINNRINLKEVSLMIFDEAHRAVGNYSYTFIASQYEKKARNNRILALTASPGSDMEKIMEVITNLHVEKVEIRTEKDPDVKPYIQNVEMQYVEVRLKEEFSSALKFLKDCFYSKIKDAKQYGLIDIRDPKTIGKKQLLGMLGGLQGLVAKGQRDFDVFKSISLVSEALKVEHAIELLETQGVNPACAYLEKLQTDSYTTKTKAVINLVQDINFKSALIKMRTLMDKGVVHPKVPVVLGMVDEILEKDPKAKIILFTNFRDTGFELTKRLELVSKAKVRQFVGQAKKRSTGLSQKEQKQMLDEFRSGEFNVLVATSVAEEGLDIPQVNAVIFYEPIPSAVRSIQRRGRTGRLACGSVKVLVTKGTRDEGYRWSAHHKEKRMYRILEELRTKLHVKQQDVNKDLNMYLTEQPLHIFVDDREKHSLIVKELMNFGIQLHVQRLDSGDYIVSNRVGIEFKTTHDFVQSILDGRLLEQMRDLKNTYERPLLIIEGTDDIYSIRNVHPNAIRGILSMITVSYGIPIIYTKNHKDTAGMLAVLAKREQSEEPKFYLPKMGEKRTLPLPKQQEYIVASLPGIGPALAIPLLKQFGSVKGLVNATPEQLQEVALIGEKKAREIRDVLDSDYA